jgi:hypothetical protein
MQEIPASVQAVNSIHRELKTKSKPSIQVRTKAVCGEAQATASLPSEIGAKKLPDVSREKDERTSEAVLDKGFGNLLPNATNRRSESL